MLKIMGYFLTFGRRISLFSCLDYQEVYQFVLTDPYPGVMLDVIVV